jgi:hypothetical protein
MYGRLRRRQSTSWQNTASNYRMADEDESWTGFGAEISNRVPFDIAFETDDKIWGLASPPVYGITCQEAWHSVFIDSRVISILVLS